MRTLTAAIAIVASLGLAVRPSRAEKFAGSELTLNSTLSGDQQLSALAAATDGHFVAVWGYRPGPSGLYRIVARVFEADLTPRSGEIVVATVPNARSEMSGDVGINRTTGEFVVVWSTYDASSFPTGVFARTFAATGAAQSQTLQLAGYGFGGARVSRSGSNWTVIAQVSDGGTLEGKPTYDIFASRYQRSGTPIGDWFDLLSYDGSQEAPEVSTNDAGEFAVACEHHVDLGSGIMHIMLVATYDALGTEIHPPAAFFLPQNEGPHVALKNDRTVFVTWMDDGIDPADSYGHGFGVAYLLIQPSGTFSIFGRANTYLPGIQAPGPPAVTHDGGFLAGWVSFEQDPDQSLGAYARRFSAAAEPVSSEMRVPLVTASTQFAPRFAIDSQGYGVAVYTSGAYGTFDVVARRIVP